MQTIRRIFRRRRDVFISYRPWIRRHPLLVFLLVAACVALGVYVAMLVSPDFGEWVRQQWGVLSECGLELWQDLRSALMLH